MKKNKAINTLTYTGIVTLSQYLGNKKTVVYRSHNEGGSVLFNFFANCLIGDFSNANKSLPTKVMFLTKPTASSNYTPVNPSAFTHLLTTPERDYEGDIPCVRYSFVIPKDRVVVARTNENIYLGLYNEENTDPADAELAQKYMAVCPVDLTGSSANAALVVDWELFISNPPTSNNDSN